LGGCGVDFAGTAIWPVARQHVGKESPDLSLGFRY
jgi:hypothetical protein